jgi:hypothetical protein
MKSVRTFGTQRADGRVADRVGRQTRDVDALEAVLRQAHGDVRFAAAEGRDESGRLQQPLERRWTQAQHDFAERDDLHWARLVIPLIGALMGRPGRPPPYAMAKWIILDLCI